MNRRYLLSKRFNKPKILNKNLQNYNQRLIYMLQRIENLKCQVIKKRTWHRQQFQSRLKKNVQEKIQILIYCHIIKYQITNSNLSIVELIMNNKSNSNIETVSTFNSSFQQSQNIVKIKTDTYSDSGKSEFNTILDRKSSDPIVSTPKVQDRIPLTRSKQQQLSIFEKIQYAILDSKHMEIDILKNHPDFKIIYIKGLNIMNYLENEYIMNISKKTNVNNEIQN